MGRISLKEQYDNKDVIQQIYLLRDNFEGLETETNEAIQAAKDAAATVGQYTDRINRAETTATEAKSTADEAKVLAQSASNGVSEASTKADMLSHALRQKPSGRSQPLAMNTWPSFISQACSMGFSYFSMRSS